MENSLLNPKNWFLSSKEKQKLKAKQRFYGESLDRALLDIDYDKDSLEYKQTKLDIDKKYDRIKQYDYEVEKIKLSEPDLIEQKIKICDLDFNLKLIDIDTYKKNIATIHKQPYVNVIKVHFSPETPNDGYFELDWNEFFIQELKDAGYNAQTDELIIKEWFDRVCCEVAKENGAIFPSNVEEFKFRTKK